MLRVETKDEIMGILRFFFYKVVLVFLLLSLIVSFMFFFIYLFIFFK